MFQRPVHFEIHASDPIALGAFYREVFGWEVNQWGDQPYWLVSTGDGNPMKGQPDTVPGINGAVALRSGPAPAVGAPVNGWVVTVSVEDAHATVAKALAAGGQVALAVERMPGVGDVGYLRDPDGNIFGVISGE
ncbi:MAG: VOC family protein [Candidatus Nanopelagicales bacterium]